MRRYRQHLAAVLVTIGLALTPSSTAAQDWSKIWKDPAVENYQFTMDNVRTFIKVHRAVARDPEAAANLDRDYKAATKEKKTVTLADAAAVVDRQPTVRAAIAGAGMTSRDYLLMSAAVSNAGLHLALQGQGVAPKTAAQKANVALLQQNQVEWKKIEQELVQIAETAAKKKE